MAEQTSILRVESFPFDSKADGYDADGYPVYDRAVGAYILRSTFAKFFTDGVFPSPGDGLAISAGTGLTVTVQPGIFIIKGAMGGFQLDADPVTLTLDTSAPQGNTCYGIMLHYDENDTASVGRSLSLAVVRGDANASPVPPEPDRTTPGIYEYRLGYVQLASGATSVSASDVHNEKGTAVCPFAAPFEDLDMDAVVIDAKAKAEESLTVFSEQLQTYYDLVQSAVDGTTAGNLQNQIDELKGGAFSEDNVDGETIIYSPTGTSGGVNKLQVKDGGLDPDKMNSSDAWYQSIVEPQFMTNERFIQYLNETE